MQSERERLLRPHQDISSSVARVLEAELVRNFIYAEEEERSACRVWLAHHFPGLEGGHRQEAGWGRAV